MPQLRRGSGIVYGGRKPRGLSAEDLAWIAKKDAADQKRRETRARNKEARRAAGCMTPAETFGEIKSAYFDWLDRECPVRHDYAGRKTWLLLNTFVYDGRNWEMVTRVNSSVSGKTLYRSIYFLSDDMEISRVDTGHAVADHGFEYYVGPRRAVA